MRTNSAVRSERIDGRGGFGVWIDQVRAFTERSLRETVRNRIMLFWAIGFPPVMYLLSTELQGTNDLGPAQQAAIAVGIGMFGAIFVCLLVFGQQLATDVEDRRYEAFRALPISPSADLVGRMLSGLVLAFGAFAVTLLAAVLTGASFGLRGLRSIPIVVVAGALSCVLWMVVAVPIVAVTADERYATFITTGIAVGAFVLTGYNGVLPEQIPFEAWLLNYLPNALPTRMLTYHLVDVSRVSGFSSVAPPSGLEFLGLLLVYTVLCLALGSAVLHRSLYERGVEL